MVIRDAASASVTGIKNGSPVTVIPRMGPVGPTGIRNSPSVRRRCDNCNRSDRLPNGSDASSASKACPATGRSASSGGWVSGAAVWNRTTAPTDTSPARVAVTRMVVTVRLLRTVARSLSSRVLRSAPAMR